MMSVVESSLSSVVITESACELVSVVVTQTKQTVNENYDSELGNSPDFISSWPTPEYFGKCCDLA
jgi:hypothetical protein